MSEHPRRRSSDRDPLPEQPWHLDKSVPIGLIVAIFIQTATAIWWSATLNARVDVLERIAASNRTDINIAAPRLAVVESQYATIKQTLDRIENKLDDQRP